MHRYVWISFKKMFLNTYSGDSKGNGFFSKSTEYSKKLYSFKEVSLEVPIIVRIFLISAQGHVDSRLFI